MIDAEYQNLQVSVEEGIAVLRVSRPEVLNALNAALLDDLERAFEAIREDDRVKAVIVTGAGEKAFVAGADIKELSGLDGISGRSYSLRGQRVFNKIESCPKPVIAAVNGYCLGGGCELALACHIRVASEKARFGQPEVKLGLIPGYGGTQRLPRLIGQGRALEILLTADAVEAKDAERMGLVNRVVPADELIDYCRQLAKKIIANGPLATGLTVQSVYSGAGLPLDQALAVEAGLFGLACGTDQMKEGTRAFLEKRKPEFE